MTTTVNQRTHPRTGRGRWGRAGLAAALALAVTGSGPVTGSAAWDRRPGVLSVEDAEGVLLASVPLDAGDRFALRYRNSLYGTLAEERFVAAGERFRLVELAADQLAVLEEYYALPGPAKRAPAHDRRAWLADPRTPVTFSELNIAATDLGERTLLVEGRQPLELWRLADGDPTVVLTIGEPRS